jgi:ligand-binding sensor domain-containing protein
MNKRMKKVHVYNPVFISVLCFLILFVLMSCSPENDSGGDILPLEEVSFSSLFTNFYCPPVYAVGIDPSGGKWFGTEQGVSFLDDKGTPAEKTDDTWTTFTATDGLADNLVNVVVIDPSGGKWFGTNGGVSYLEDNGTPAEKTDDTWITFTTTDGLAPLALMHREESGLGPTEG